MFISIEDFDEKIKPIRKELLDGEFLKTPSVYCLERAGDQLLSLVNQLREKNDKFESWLDSLKMDLEIYLADLGGELQHDYDKGNKRYKGKWLAEKSKLIGFISKFRTKILENKTTE